MRQKNIHGEILETIVRVDAKGCITIPIEIRKRLGIEHVARISIENDKIIIEPIRDPIEFLESTVISGTSDIEIEIGMIRRSIDDEMCKEVKS